jgi:hypothetical protein
MTSAITGMLTTSPEIVEPVSSVVETCKSISPAAIVLTEVISTIPLPVVDSVTTVAPSSSTKVTVVTAFVELPNELTS